MFWNTARLSWTIKCSEISNQVVVQIVELYPPNQVAFGQQFSIACLYLICFSRDKWKLPKGQKWTESDVMMMMQESFRPNNSLAVDLAEKMNGGGWN